MKLPDHILQLQFRTLTEALLAAPPERSFITDWIDEDEIQTVTFGEFTRATRARAADLRKLGVKFGETLILVMPQGIPLMTTFAGAMLLGAIPTILAYPSFKVDAAKYKSGLIGVSRNLQAGFVVVDDDLPEDLISHVSQSDGTRVVRMSEMSAELDDVSESSKVTCLFQNRCLGLARFSSFPLPTR